MSDASSVTGAPDRHASPTSLPVRSSDEVLLPPQLTGWFHRIRRTWTPADRAALVVGLASLGPVLYVVLGGALYADDIRGLALLSTAPLPDTLLWTNGTHVVPGTHLVFWLHGRLAGYDYWPAMLVIPILRAAAAFAVWRMLRLLFGSRRGTVAVFALYAFTPLSLSATAWYVQAITLLPVHLAVAGATIAMVRYHRTRLTRYALAAGAAMAGGLCFAEKTVVLLAFLPVLASAVLPVDRGVRVRVRVLGGLWPVWAAMTAVAGAWSAIFLFSGASAGRSFSWTVVPQVVGEHLWSGLIPTFAAGPWRWRQGATFYESAPFYGIAEPPLVASLLGTVVVLVVLGLAARRSPARVVEGLAVLLAYYVPCAALVVLARAGELGTQVGTDLRFWADAVPAIAVAAGVAIVGVPGRSGHPPLPPARSSAWRSWPTRTGTVLVGVWLVLLGLTTVDFASAWHHNPSAGYLATLSRQMGQLEGTAHVYDTEVPENVLSPLFRPRTDVSFVTPVLGSQLRFGTYVNDMLVVDDLGRLVPASWRTVETSGDGPVDACGWRLGPENDAQVEVALRGRVPFAPDHSLRLDFLAGRPTTVAVDVWDGRGWQSITRQKGIGSIERFEIPEGLVAIVLKTPVSAVERIRVRGRPEDGHICLLRAAIGVPLPRTNR